jgi:hypothetical protein
VNHLAQTIYALLQNQYTEAIVAAAESLSVSEVAALHELESLLRLPVTDLAEMLTQTDPPEWTLDIERPGLR